MKTITQPLYTIPEVYRPDFISQITKAVKLRSVLFCVVVTILYLIAYCSAFYLSPLDLENSEFAIMGALVCFTAVIFFLNRRVKSLTAAKWMGFVSIAVFLSILILGNLKRPDNFNYSGFILSLFFSSLMIPWFVRDVFVIAGIHFTAFYVYCTTRDFSQISIPQTIFGDDPFLNGSIFIGFAALMCLAVRVSDSKRYSMNYLLMKDIEAKKIMMDQELDVASRVHGTLVPQSVEMPHAKAYVTYKPMVAIGGDYANFRIVDQNRFMFFIGDVTGHGVPAALMVNRLHTEFDRLSSLGQTPGELLNNLNQFVLKAFTNTHMFLTAFCGMLNAEEKKIYFSSYGHPPQYLHRSKSREIVSLESLASLLGVDLGEENAIYEKELDYTEGDTLFLFTDGILEIKNGLGEEFGGSGLQEFIRAHDVTKQSEFHELLIKKLLSFGSDNFKDDVFVISIQCR